MVSAAPPVGPAMTWPVVTFMAAMMEMVPCRTYSNSRRAFRPVLAGISGCLRDLAWMPGGVPEVCVACELQ